MPSLSFCWLALTALLTLSLAGCDSAAPPAARTGVEVRGVAVRTVERPDGTGEVCGRPTRTSGPLAAVPNPYRGVSTYESSGTRILRFVNLPPRVRIEIVRGYWYTVGPEPVGQAVGGALARAVSRTGQTVRVIEKASQSRSVDWDLRDESGELVPSGFYRAFFVLEEGSAAARELGASVVFDDLYIVQREVSGVVIRTGTETVRLGDGSWADPTGCL